mgnify:FL=1
MVEIQNINCGNSFEFSFNYTERVHSDFMRFSGDDSNIHTSLDFATKNGYKGVIGYAFALTAFLSKIYGTQFPGGNELCLKQECNFRNPFYVGDRIIFTITVRSINFELKTLELTSSAKVDGGILIFTGLALLKLSLS